MRAIPVDVAAFTGFACVMLPEPKLVDIETGEVRKDRRSGQTVYVVGVCAMRGRDSSVIQVSVVGEPAGLVLGGPVQVNELEASPWDRDGRSGVAWRASAVTPVLGTPAPGNSGAAGTGRRAAPGSGTSTGTSPRAGEAG